LKQLEEMGLALSPHCALAASPKPANKATVKKTFFIIKRFKLLIIM
jgi:hypothetical protein